MLFVTQGHHGIDAGGAAGVDVARDEGHESEKRRDAQKCEPNGGTHAEQKSGHETHEPERGDDSDDDAQERELSSLFENDPGKGSA